MVKTCQQCQTDFAIEANEQDFLRRMGVPAPTFCWRCRMQRRFAWRNERKLYPSQCSKTGKPIITMFDPEQGYVVYDREVWWADDWSALDFNQDYDWSKPFFTQWRELFNRVPHPAVFNNKCTNSTYCNHIGNANNCYLVYATWIADNVSYSHQVIECRDSFDISASSQSELVYYTTGGDHLYNTQFAQDAIQSRDSMLLFDCRNVHDCFGCTNLRNKSFCWFNEQLDEATYRQRVAAADTGSYKNLTALRQQFAEFKTKSLHRFAHIINAPGSTGENIVNVENSQYIFDGKTDVTDCRYLVNTLQISDSQDGYGIGGHADLLYEGVDFGVEGSHMAFGIVVWGGRDNFYCYNVTNSHDCFGCIGLRNAAYCIFNQQYTQEAYEQLLPKVIQHMNEQPYLDAKGRTYKYGEFFPVELSPFGYNETVAQEQFSLTPEQVAAQGWRWQHDTTLEKNFTRSAAELPDHINDVADSICNDVIQCLHQGNCNEQCTQVYKIIPKEFDYLRQHNIAPPRLCPNCRHFERLAEKLPFNLWQRSCLCQKTEHVHAAQPCPKTFLTPYAPNRPETIYCEDCYQAIVS